MEVKASLLYTAASVNPQSGILDVYSQNAEQFAVFGSGRIVCVAKQNLAQYGGLKITQTLFGHESEVTCTSVVSSEKNVLIVSADANGVLRIWAAESGDFTLQTEFLVGSNKQAISSCHAVIDGASDVIICCTCLNTTHFITWSMLDRTIDGTRIPPRTSKDGELCLVAKLVNINADLQLCFVGLDTGCVEVLARNRRAPLHFSVVHRLLGHEDWVSSIDVQLHAKSGFLMLATGSQDNFIRIWRLSTLGDDQSAGDGHIARLPELDQCISIELESVCAGHENWVEAVRFQPTNLDQKAETWQLISCSMDCSIIVWQQDRKSPNSPWLERRRFGTVGDHAVGVFDCHFSPDAQFLYAVGLRVSQTKLFSSNKFLDFQGNLSVWHMEQIEWVAQPPLVGHRGPVTDLSWSADYLLTSGQDQTVRLHAPLKSSQGSGPFWHELARPQTHGYDMNAVCSISAERYASAGDEKVVRVFRRSRAEGDGESRVVQPALGLSNLSAHAGNDSSLALPDKAPDEPRLHRETLWPEEHKLYGHGNEVCSLAVRADGKVLASASKAAQQATAEIILWDCENWTIRQRLIHHQSTVTTLSFSPAGCGQDLLLAASRDRNWSVFVCQGDTYHLLHVDQAPRGSKTHHRRIIWTACWAHDASVFFTGSRDKILSVWRTADAAKLADFDQIAAPVTACDAISLGKGVHLLAVGCEGGRIALVQFNLDALPACFSSPEFLDSCSTHSPYASVKSLRFRTSEDNMCLLASAGEDGLLRIYNVYYAS